MTIIMNAWSKVDQIECGALHMLHNAWQALSLVNRDMMYRKLRWELRHSSIQVYWRPGYGLWFDGPNCSEICAFLAFSPALSQAQAFVSKNEVALAAA